jgi:hypothetical protein
MPTILVLVLNVPLVMAFVQTMLSLIKTVGNLNQSTILWEDTTSQFLFFSQNIVKQKEKFFLTPFPLS